MGWLSNSTCPVPDGATGTAHQPMLWVSGISTAVTFVISVTLILAHIRRYRCPREQRQIIRISFAPFVFALVAFCEVLDYRIAPYIDPIGDLYEAFGLCALFLLYIQYAAPGGTFDEQTLETVRAAEEGSMTSFDWPRITWIFVFQYPLTELLSIIILEATEAAGKYCVQSLSPRFGRLWVQIISSIGVGAAVLAIIRFYGRMKSRMKVRRGLAKLVCFKLIVGLRFLQSLIFSILLDQNVIKPSKIFTYNDILYGLESTLTCAEMAVIGLGFWYCYSSTEYGSAAKPRQEPLPIHKAILNALNPVDLFAGIGRLFGIILNLQRNGGFQEWNKAKAQAKADKAGKSARGQGRYQTIDGMESLTRPGAAHDISSSQFDTSYPMLSSSHGQQLYQPPPGSPPSYDDGTRDPRSSYSPPEHDRMLGGRMWDGQRYERSPSPGGKFIEGRDMV